MKGRPNTPLADELMSQALHDIMTAEQLLDRAIQATGCLRGGAPEYEATRETYERVHALWFRLEKRRTRGGLSTDREPELRQVHSLGTGT